MWDDKDFSPETVDEELEYLKHNHSQQLNAKMTKELRDTCEEDQMIVNRAFARYSARINAQSARYAQPEFKLAPNGQQKQNTPSAIVTHHQRKSSSNLGQIFTLVAVLLVAFVLVGSTLWMVNALHRIGSVSPMPTKGGLGSSHSLTATASAGKSTLTPTGRANAQLAYDEAKGSVLLFSGQDYTGVSGLNDTWTWNGSFWTQLHPVHSPSPRTNAAIAYNPSTHQIMMFGGLSASVHMTPLGDTWIWNGSDWIQQHPASSPSARMYASLAYDPSTGQFVLFGGRHTMGLGPPVLNETWVWTGSNWVQQHPATTPIARTNASMVYDNVTQQLILFGGQDGYHQILNDTWIWTGSDWVQQHPATVPILSAKVQGHTVAFYNTSMTYETSMKKVLLTFYGTTDSGSAQTDFWAQTNWNWDGSNWTQLNTTTLNVDIGQLFYDARHNRVYGLTSHVIRTSPMIENEIWQWTGKTWVLFKSW